MRPEKVHFESKAVQEELRSGIKYARARAHLDQQLGWFDRWQM